MRKLLIAEGDEILSSALTDLLRRTWDITVCADGGIAAELLDTLRPDAMILDLSLPTMDGLFLLEETMDLHPRVIVGISDFCNDYVNQVVRELGVCYMFRKPCLPHAIAARLEHLMRYVPLPHHADGQTKAAQLLIDFQFATKNDGFRFLKIGLPLFAQDSQQRICKELYASIASICGAGSWNQVERSIRSAIDAAWRTRAPAWEKYFPGASEPPTAKTFISRVAQILMDS